MFFKEDSDVVWYRNRNYLLAGFYATLFTGLWVGLKIQDRSTQLHYLISAKIGVYSFISMWVVGILSWVPEILKHKYSKKESAEELNIYQKILLFITWNLATITGTSFAWIFIIWVAERLFYRISGGTGINPWPPYL